MKIDRIRKLAAVFCAGLMMLSAGACGKGSSGGQIVTMSEEDIDRYRTLINDATVQGNINSRILNVINDEANSFFAGNCDVNTAAGNIQSRITLYLSEQYS